MRKPAWSAENVMSSPGVEALYRRDNPEGDYELVDPQPKLMVVIIDEADPHPNERNSYAGQYGVLYVQRDDNVKDKDVFWYTDPDGQRFRWGVVGQARWNHPNVLTRFDFGVKQFRIRKGG
jgi:hypothetical protein